MSAPRLNSYQRDSIDSEVDELFNNLLTRLLGYGFAGKSLFIGFTHGITIPGLYEAAVNEEGGYVEPEIIRGISSVTEDLINKYRADAKAITKRKIQGLLYDIDAGRLKPENFGIAVGGELVDIYSKIKQKINVVVASEMMHATTIGAKEGIDQINENLGIDDPVLCWIHPIDKNTCEGCYRIYYLSDRRTPRVWKESEVSAEYFKKGNTVPSWHLTHPNCRGALSTVLPGFGFDALGRVTYIADKYSEWDYQRGFKVRPTPGVDARRSSL